MPDNILSLEAIYYSAPIPRNLAALTTLGLVFDKLHFPGVYLPKDGFSQADLDAEIKRIADLRATHRFRDDGLLSILSFVRHVNTLDGFCTFNSDFEGIFGNKNIPQDLVHKIYNALHGPNPPGWHPMFDSAHSKELPGSRESVTYLGTYHYFASAVITSAQMGLPLINDVAEIPMGGSSSYRDDAQALAALLALRCATLIMPRIPVLQPHELMEFRAEHKSNMAAFRREMFKLAAQLNEDIKSATPEEVEKKAEFFIKTTIIPQLDELANLLNNPRRGWMTRLGDIVKFSPHLISAYGTGGGWAALTSILSGLVPDFVNKELQAEDRKKSQINSGLHYLLQIRDLSKGT
jgi:hypothetical protein